MKTIIALVLFIFAAPNLSHAQLPSDRLNLEYGDSRCNSWTTKLFISLPDRGLTLYGELFSTSYYRGAKNGWIILGINRIKWPILVGQTGQSCDLLTFPQLQFNVPMSGAWGKIKLFDIPMSKEVIGLRLYAQGGFEVLPGREGFSRGVEFSIQ